MEPFQRYQPLIDDWPAFQGCLLRPLPTCIWANTLRLTPAELAGLLAADGLEFEPLSWYPGGFQLPTDFKPGHHWAFWAGLYQVQEAVSMLPVPFLDPRPHERVLDLCAAPGNKTAQIAVSMKNRGTLVANDINVTRMRAARQVLERLGLVNVTTTSHDGANYPRAAGLFDKILVDAPCSCEGTSRKEAKVIHSTGQALSRKKSGGQKALLRKAVQLCKPGGRIVYATCTYAPEENELVVDAVLREYGSDQLRLASAAIDGLRTSPGVTAWQGRQLDPTLAATLRIWPHHNDTGGFYVAILEKSGHSDKRAVHPASDSTGYDSTEARNRLQPVLDRFGIPAAGLDRYNVFQPGRRKIYLSARDHAPSPGLQTDAAGMMALKTGVKYPKLTTAAARLLGQDAVKNVIDANREQLQRYLTRQSFTVSIEQSQACTGVGYVLVRYQGFSIGVGVYEPGADGNNGVVHSLFPKGWSRAINN